MSRRNHPEQKAARRKQRLEKALSQSYVKRHGVCWNCDRRTILWLPAGICEKCLEEVT